MAGRHPVLERGQALIEAAIVIPILLLLIAGGLIFGLATVDDIRLERATGDAAQLSKQEARRLIRSVGGQMVCWSDKGECFDDGLSIERVQIISEGREWVYPTGSFTPIAQVSRPIDSTEGQSNETVDTTDNE